MTPCWRLLQSAKALAGGPPNKSLDKQNTLSSELMLSLVV